MLFFPKNGLLLKNFYLIFLKYVKIRDVITIKVLPKSLLNLVILIVLDLLISLILPINSTSRFLQIINICVLGIILLPVYLKLNKKYLNDILPNKILKILTKLHI